MKLNQLLLLSCVALLASGCASVSVKENLLVLRQGYFSDEQQESKDDSEKANTPHPLIQEYKSEKVNTPHPLIQAYKQIKSPDFKIAKDAQFVKAALETETEPLPFFMANEPLVQKIIIAAYEALEDQKDSVVEVSKNDIKSMTGMLKDHFSANAINRKAERADSEKKINKIIQKYLSAYYSEKSGFVNREGTVFKRPEINNSIGNDIITAVIAISLEGLLDGLLSTPIYIDGAGKYQTNEGREPSAHHYKYATSEKIVDKGQEGIDELEVKAIRYLSGLAGDQSKILSGAAYRAFGGFEISFVIGGKFSFGDNETLAKIIDTSFEVASKRIVEEGAYRGFKKLTVEYPIKISPDNSKAKNLLYEIE